MLGQPSRGLPHAGASARNQRLRRVRIRADVLVPSVVDLEKPRRPSALRVLVLSVPRSRGHGLRRSVKVSCRNAVETGQVKTLTGLNSISCRMPTLTAKLLPRPTGAEQFHCATLAQTDTTSTHPPPLATQHPIRRSLRHGTAGSRFRLRHRRCDLRGGSHGAMG